MWVRDSAAAGDFAFTKMPQEGNVADVLMHAVEYSAFVRAGARHGSRLELAVRPGSWRDRGPSGVGSCIHAQLGLFTPHVANAVPASCTVLCFSAPIHTLQRLLS